MRPAPLLAALLAHARTAWGAAGQLRGGAANAPGASEGAEEVRILHLSDTHNLHRTIEATYPLPPADILIHSGDFTNFGTDGEMADANAWLGTLKGRYQHIIALVGNHDWIAPAKLPAAVTHDVAYWQQRLSNAVVLFQGQVTVMGLTTFGSSWKGGQMDVSPQGFGDVPSGVDILVTHGPPAGVLDWTGGRHWGSSMELLNLVVQDKPKVHLFGHVHEQRGVWQRTDHGYVGGVQYQVPGAGHPYATTRPPPADYPTQVFSNNAMMNHPATEGWAPHRIAGPARLITGTRVVNGTWQFRT